MRVAKSILTKEASFFVFFKWLGISFTGINLLGKGRKLLKIVEVENSVCLV